MLDKIKVVCAHSLTMAWAYVMGVVSFAMQEIDNFAALVGDNSFGKQVESLLGTDPKMLGRYLMAVSAITIAARLRGVVAKKP